MIKLDFKETLIITVITIIGTSIFNLLFFFITERYNRKNRLYTDLKFKSVELLIKYAQFTHNPFKDSSNEEKLMDMRRVASNELRLLASQWGAYSTSKNKFSLCKRKYEKANEVKRLFIGLANGLIYNDTAECISEVIQANKEYEEEIENLLNVKIE